VRARFSVAHSTDQSRYSGAKGEPLRACGRAWVERPKSGITSLTDAPGAVDEQVAVARGGVVVRGVASPREPEQLYEGSLAPIP
jgi:hypothetical protein